MATTSQHVHDHDSGEGLVPVVEARERLLAKIDPLQPLQLPLADAYGGVLAAEVIADRDLPEFPLSAMDGLAVRSGEVGSGGSTPPGEVPVFRRASSGQP